MQVCFWSCCPAAALQFALHTIMQSIMVLTFVLLHAVAWLSPRPQSPSALQPLCQTQPQLLQPRHGLLLLLSWWQPSPSAPLAASLTGARLKGLCWSSCPSLLGECVGSQHAPPWPLDMPLQLIRILSIKDDMLQLPFTLSLCCQTDQGY